MKIAYLDCFSGISGDMFVGALLDAGLPFSDLDQCLQSLQLKGYHIEVRREARSGIFGTRFVVTLDKEAQVPRGMNDIRSILESADLESRVRETCMRIFEDLAKVEGNIHNVPPERVHFHEIGAVDSILDIVGAVYGIQRLGIGAIYVSALPVGSGFTDSAHGTIPLPAPATLALLKGIPIFDSGVQREMVTPTGAALVKTLATSFGIMPPMAILELGYGAGKRDLPDRPNLLRILIGEDRSGAELDTVIVLESNLDDMNPEWTGYLMERLFAAGAFDVVFCPIQMKKNRPGVQIQIIAPPDHKEALTEILFSETTTLGVRFRYSERRVLQRSVIEVESPWGTIKVKRVVRTDGSHHLLPEYEACREIAVRTGRPLREIFSWVTALNK